MNDKTSRKGIQGIIVRKKNFYHEYYAFKDINSIIVELYNKYKKTELMGKPQILKPWLPGRWKKLYTLKHTYSGRIFSLDKRYVTFTGKNRGTYIIEAKTKDFNGFVSHWSEPLTVTMSIEEQSTDHSYNSCKIS